MTSTNKFESVYLQAKYLVRLKDGRYCTLKIGKQPPKELVEILNKKNVDSFAYITAYNPCSVLVDKPDNKLRTNKLIDHLQNLKRDFLWGKSISTDRKWDETFVCILGISLEEAEEIAFNLSQVAFLYGRKNSEVQMHWTFKDTN